LAVRSRERSGFHPAKIFMPLATRGAIVAARLVRYALDHRLIE
jgi:hypothetical protein